MSFSTYSTIRGLRVLLVDDDPDTLDLVKLMLEMHHAIVTAVASAAEALELFPKVQPDVVITDIAMPGEDGFAVLRKIRRAEAKSGKHIPTIALTGALLDEHQSQQVGFEKLLTKPVLPDELVETVAGVVAPIGIA